MNSLLNITGNIADGKRVCLSAWTADSSWISILISDKLTREAPGARSHVHSGAPLVTDLGLNPAEGKREGEQVRREYK